MPVQLTYAIRRLRSLLNEPAAPTAPAAQTGVPRFYSDTELTEWINDGLRDVSRRAEELITYDTSIAIPAYGENPIQPVPTYSLPDDVVRINRVEFQVANDSSQIYSMEASTQNQMDNMWAQDQLSTATYPGWWVTRGYPGGSGRNNFVIQLYPNPGQAGQLNLFYYRMPTRINDPVADPSQYLVTLDILEGWEDMVIDYAHMRALLKARDSRYSDIQAMYETKITAIIDQSRRFNDQPQYFSYDSMMMPWGDNGGGSW
jgi:hypothetical protein